MLNSIDSSGVHAANIQNLRQNRAKKTEAAPQENTATTEKPAHPAHPHGKVPPGLARAAEKIAAKIFERADADSSGTVTQEELSAVHSKHAQTLAASDLFKSTPLETPTDIESTDSTTTTETTTEATTETTTETPTETETPSPVGVTADQLKEALTRYFYAKVGATYTPSTPPATEPPVTETPTDTVVTEPTTDSTTDTTSSTPETVSEQFLASQTLTVVA